MFTQGRNYKTIPRSCMILDMASTVSCSNNKSLLKNIHVCKPEEMMVILKNGGSQDFDMIGDLNVIPIKLYNNADSIPTILDFKDICSIPGVRVKMDTKVDESFHVQLTTGQVFNFTQYSKYMYCFDTDQVNNDTNNHTFNHYIILKTVKNNQVYLRNRK